MEQFPAPVKGSVFYEDDLVYACLAFTPIVEGHTIVVWKKRVYDLRDLPDNYYIYFMKFVLRVRTALYYVYPCKKVYMCYLDEICHVHFQLFPRVNDIKGWDFFNQPAGVLTDFSKVPLLKALL